MTESSREQALERVIADFLLALDSGNIPDRDALLAAHPDLAQDLRAFFQEHDRFGRLVSPLRETSSEATVRMAGFNPPASDGPGTFVSYFGDYELISELGRGGMGVVYLARQISLNRPVALKMLKSDVLATDDERRRFQNEAEAVALLDHPNIVPILEVGEHEGRRYFSMKLISGASLEKKVADYCSNPTVVAKLVAAMAEAIYHAHQRGILHRDLKPSNILLDVQNQPFVTDFGLAKRVENEDEMTHTGAILGTPAYMSPEQASGRRASVTTASDIYGLGAILYALLAGRAPFSGENVIDTLRLVRESAPERPSRINPSVPRDLEVIALKCLDKDPVRRYSTAQHLAEDLHRYLLGEPIIARPVGAMERGIKWAIRRPLAAAFSIVSVLAVLATVGLLVAWRYNGQLRQARDAEQVQRSLAEDRDRQARSYWYAADIGLAQRMWDLGRVTEAIDLLERQAPKPGAEDLRGFEWYYLRRLFRSTISHVQAVTADEYGDVRLHFSRDGRSLYVSQKSGYSQIMHADHAGIIAILDPTAGTRRQTLRESSTLTSAIFCRERFAFVDENRCWIGDIANGEYRPAAELPPGIWRIDALSSDGATALVYGGEANDFKRVFIDLATGHVKKVLTEVSVNTYDEVAMSPDGETVAVAGQEMKPAGEQPGVLSIPVIHSWNLNDIGASPVIYPSFERVSALAIADDSHRIVVAGISTGSTIDRPAVEFWDVSSKPARMTHRLDLNGEMVRAIAISRDGRSLAVTSRTERVVRIFHLDVDPRFLNHPGTWLEYSVLRGAADYVTALAFSDDGARLAACDQTGAVSVWDPRVVPEAEKGPVYYTYESPVFLPDSRTLVVEGPDGVDLLDTVTWQRLGRAQGSGQQYAFAVSPDGHTLAVCRRREENEAQLVVQLWDIATRSEVKSLVADEFPSGSVQVAFSPDSKIVAVGALPGDDGTENLEAIAARKSVRLWDLPKGEARALSNDADGPLAFAPDGHSLVTAGSDNRSIRFWDPATGAPKAVWTDTERADCGLLLYSPDGRQLAAAAWYGRGVGVWDVATKRLVHKLRCPGARVAAFTPDGKTFITSEGDSSLTLWQLSTGQELMSLKGHQYGVIGLAVSPDGTRLATTAVHVDRSDPVHLWVGEP